MQYNYDFEIAAFLLMAIILMHFIFVRQFPTEKGRVFKLLLITCLAECGTNILSCIGLANPEFVPQIVNELLAFAFFILEGLASYMIFRYVVTVCDFERNEAKRLKLFGKVPFLVFELLVLLTPWIGFFYYLEDNKYYQGFGAGFGYFYIAYYFLLNIVLLLRRWKRVEPNMKVILLIYSFVAIGAIFIQYEIRNLLLTSAGNLIVLFMIYLSMQNPNELINPVTGVGNDDALMLRLKQILSYENDEEGSIITVAVKQFHHINTLFGVENGRKLMDEAGIFLYQLAGRFHVFYNGNGIFTLIIQSKVDSEEILEKIKCRFAEEWQVQQNSIVMDAGFVVQHYPKDFSTEAEFIQMREYLLGQMRKSGTQNIIRTDEKMIEKFWRISRVEMAIRTALEENTLQVYYQPIYSLEEKRIVSLEALVRLKDPELGFVPPDEFIPIAEKNGSIIQIGDRVLEESCKFLAKHVLSNVSLGLQTIQINMSVAQCMQQNLKEKIVPILSRYHVPPTMITLEITESTAINTTSLMQRHMKELGELGIRFAVDDYGSGNSNSSYLVKFPFKEVKIDKEMTWAYFQNDTARIILENEIKVMKKLGIPIVVEGIEKLEQSEEMERLGVQYIQGYYYGKPLPEAECLRYIRNFNFVPEEYGR